MGQQQILLLVVAAIVVVLAITIGFDMFNANAKSANRDNIVSDLNNLSTLAIQFYKKPTSYGGGNLSFNSWNIPVGLDTTSNGMYSVACSNDNATITASGLEIGNDGSTPIQMVATVTASNIVINVIN